ncbi:uncharacterized protein LOC121637788 [Melanotaenia boesemani]|uniref:uncharacterized protein LOC121637788 n=1 Tax=Melanotaenia boesemani TaxID=1250792 RepID=UPI001C04C1BC|nr:uncharacterized protein LOC121637788 [Melanotaenia boesemani]
MELTALNLLWLLCVFTLTTQELVKLKLSPIVTTECGKQVSLHCNASSYQHGLSITHMEWSQGKMSLCSVDSEEEMITHQRHSLSEFHCEYKDGQLSLIFQEVLPLESGNSKPYRCKLHSNQGVAHGYTRVEIQECCGSVKGVLTSEGPACTFQRAHPDGDVHWFHGSRNLSDGSMRQDTAKSVNTQGWVNIHSSLTIHDDLDWRSSNVPFNCSLRSTKSGRYIASALIQNNVFHGTSKLGAALSGSNRVGSQETMKTALSIILVLLPMLK